MRGSHKVALLTFVGLLSQASTIISSIVLVRFLSQESYGIFRQLFLITSTCLLVCTFGLPTSILFSFPKISKGEQKGYLIQTMVLLAISGTVGTLIVFFLSGYIAVKFDNPVIQEILPFFSLYILFQVSIQYISAMYMGLDKYKHASIIQIAMQLSHFFVVMGSVYFWGDLHIVMRNILIFAALQTAVLIPFSLRKFKDVSTVWKKDFLRKQLGYSLPLGLSFIVDFLGREIDKCCFALFFSPAIYAIYVVGALEIPMFREIGTAISSVLVPKISELHHESKQSEIASLWKETIRKSILIFFPSFGLLLLVSKQLIIVLFTETYGGATIVFQIYLCLILLRIFNPNIILQALGKTKLILLNSICFVTINTVLNIVFIKVLKLGISGPAIATIISFLWMNLFAFFAALSYTDFSFKQVFPSKDFSKISVAVILGYIIPKYFFNILENNHLVNGLLLGTVFVLVFALSGWMMKVFDRDDIQIVTRILRK